MRLLVSDLATDAIEHARFTDLPRWLSPGDLLVVNTSGTMNAALAATAARRPRVRAASVDSAAGRILERRSAAARRQGVAAVHRGRAGTAFRLPAGGRATLLAPYPFAGSLASRSRLWVAAFEIPDAVVPYLERHGRPIRYGYVPRSWPSAMYQTVFATEPGSAEMPSAGRPFTAELVTRLVSRGVEIAPLLLHTGVAAREPRAAVRGVLTVCRARPPNVSTPRAAPAAG